VLLREFGPALDAVRIVPGFDGAFEVRIDGELVHSRLRSGTFPKPEEIVAAVRSRLQG
jgi:selenoprotein W-related protein